LVTNNQEKIIFMKKTLLIFLLAFLYTGQSQTNEWDFITQNSETKILYDRVFGLSKISTIEKKIVSSNYVKQVYHEIQRADILQRWTEFGHLKKRSQQAQIEKLIPIMVLVSELEYLNPELANTNVFIQNELGQFEIKPGIENAILKKNIRLAAPLLGQSRDAGISFVYDPELIFTTTDVNVTKLEMDIHNGNGFFRLLPLKPVQVYFNSAGKKDITFKIGFSDGTSELISSKIEVLSSPTIHQSTQEVQTIQATVPYQGHGESAPILGQAEYEIYLDNVDGVLDKPIFLIDGFDPGDTRNTSIIYELLNFPGGGNLGDVVRGEGYDIVVVNFPQYNVGETTIDGGADFIQRNAMSLVALIEHINNLKVGEAQNVIIGPSMGGLISRYALRYMEINSLDHDTRLYISFDSPHLGANVPIGFQHLFNYMAYGPLGDVTLQGVVDGLLRSSAARQMLIDHFEGHLQEGNTTEFNNNLQLPIGAPNYRDAFQSELNDLGFPTTVRNVTISNGSNNGAMTGTPGMWVLNDYTVNATATQRARFDLRFTPPAGVSNQLVSRFRAQQQIIVWITLFSSQANATSPGNSSGLDSAPGGTFEIADFGGGDPTLDDFIDNLAIDKFCFIPTLSSLAISNPNWYASVSGAGTSPFVNSFVPSANEPHVTLTSDNVAFALSEILTPLNINDLMLSSIQLINPVRHSIELFFPQHLTDATLSLSDLSGKRLWNETRSHWDGYNQIDLNLSQGVYFLEIRFQNQKQVIKLIKN